MPSIAAVPRLFIFQARGSKADMPISLPHSTPCLVIDVHSLPECLRADPREAGVAEAGRLHPECHRSANIGGSFVGVKLPGKDRLQRIVTVCKS
jgi:hypothetical protein